MGAADRLTHGGLAQKRDETLDRVVAIAGLGPEGLGRDDDHALVRHAAARERSQPRFEIVGKVGRAERIEAQLHRRRRGVDMLSARAGGSNERLADLALVDRDEMGDGDHARRLPPETPRRAQAMRA